MKHHTCSVLLILAVALLPVFAHSARGEMPSDGDIAKLLVGHWTTSAKSGSRNLEFSQGYRFNKDGTVTSQIQALTSAFTADVIDFSGTWKVSKGTIEVRVTNWQSSNSKIKAPTVPHLRKVPLDSINDEMWKTRAEDAVDKPIGEVHVFKRVKK